MINVNFSSSAAAWGEFGLAMPLFVASHSIVAWPDLRRPLLHLMGARLYRSVYSLLSLALLAWVLRSASMAPVIPLWNVARWHYFAPLLTMPLVCLLAVLGLAVANPFSLGGSSTRVFRPDAPGIVGLTRHPLLWAVPFWAISHIVANGDLAHVLLFSTFALHAFVRMVTFERRSRRTLGAVEWRRLGIQTSFFPGMALVTGSWRPHWRPEVLWRVLYAALLYGGLLLAHATIIGVSPFPFL